MNLNDVLRDPSSKKASLTNLSEWYDEGMLKPGEPTYDPSDNNRNNNTKDDLEVEWGYGNIETIYSDEEGPVPAGVSSRNVPTESLADASSVILFARDQMNRGTMGPDLMAQLKERFDQPSLRAASSELHGLLQLEGIVGTLVVDARGYEDPRQAVAATQESPYKQFIKYIIAEERDAEDYLWLPKKGGKVADHLASQSTGNAVDDFFGSMDKEDKPALVAHCKQTMMPILTADIDPSEVDDTLIDVMNVVQLPAAYQTKKKGPGRPAKEHNDKYASFREIQRVFVAADRMRRKLETAAYEQKVDSTGFNIDKADAPIEFAASAMPDIDVDNSKRSDAQVDIDAPYGMSAALEFAEEKPTSLEGISLEGIDLFAVEMDHQPGEKIFAGCDEIELGEQYSGPDLLDVDVAQDMAVDFDDEEITW